MKKLILIPLIIVISFITGMDVQRPHTPPTVITVTGALKSDKPGYVKSGEYNAHTNTITIDTMHARRQGLTYEQVLAHEMTHYRQHRDHPILSTVIEVLYKNDYEHNPLEIEARKAQNNPEA